MDSLISRWQQTSSMLLPWPMSLSPAAIFRITSSGVCRRRFLAQTPHPSWSIGLAHYVAQLTGAPALGNPLG